eukprot:scaffold4261_cov250-Chaetoceros_neogracile.AAC.8
MGAETPSNAITLSFNGVDFRLVPTGNSSNTNSSVSLSTNNGTYTTINLESFTGSLVVHSSSPIALNNTAATPVDSADISARTVEDEPATPESYSNKEETLLEQGQKKLPFERVNSKKRTTLSTERKTKKRCNPSNKDAVPSLGQSSQMTQGNVENEDQANTIHQSTRKMSRSSSIEKLVEQEEMKGTQTEVEEDEPTQIIEDSLNQDEDDVLQINPNAIM